MKFIFALAALCITSFCLAESSIERAILKRIYAHLHVQDPSSACLEAQEALHVNPHSISLHEAYLKALAQAGDDKNLHAAWLRYSHLFPEEAKNNFDLHEHLAWGVINKAFRSSSPIIRLTSVIAAFFSQDARGVEILHKSLRDPNTHLRGSAVQLCGHYRDESLCDEIMRMLQEEKVWKVRLEVIKAIGKMKIKQSKSALLAIIANTHTTAEEKAAAIKSLINIMESLDRQEIISLASSDRAGLRLLACQAVSHLQNKSDVDQILPLVSDNRAEVRASALRTLGHLGIRKFSGQSVAAIAQKKLTDPSPETAITSAWLLTILEPEKGGKAFTALLHHDVRDIRLQAAAALASTGKYGVNSMKKEFNQTQDPFVKMNLALGLIKQQTQIEEACEALYHGLTKESGRWMWVEEGQFQSLTPSTIKYDDDLNMSPETANQLVRLEILNILAIMKYSKAQDAVKEFLQNKKWGITGMASALLLTEGDENAVQLVYNLLEDPNHQIQMQAAMILALWGRGEKVITFLEESFDSSDRETKEKILEGIGRIGSRSSVPFLLEKLHEPQETLRIIAAYALLQCLYH